MNNKDKIYNYRKSYESKIIEKILASDEDECYHQTPSSINFSICVDIGDGKKGIININQQSHPLACALEFCHQYNLDEVVVGVLCQSIRQKIQNEKKTHSMEMELRSVELYNKSKKLNQQNIVDKIDNNKAQSRKNSIPHPKQNTKNSTPVNKSLQKSKELEQYTYKPKLNQISRIITQKRGLRDILEEIDINKKKKEQKIDKIKEQLYYKQLEECSFQPKINLINSRVYQQNRQEISSQKRYQYLYLLNEKNKFHSRNGSKQNFTFKPEINHLSKSIVLGMSFEQRQQKFKQKKCEVTTPVVNSRPKTGREPLSRNKDKLPIGEYLYNEGKKKSFDFSSQHPTEIKSVMLQKSSDIIKQKQQKRLKQIFETLDKNQDGILCYEEMNPKEINPDIYNIFKPILEEMKLLNIKLNCEEFIEASNRLIPTLTPQQKNKILDTKKKNEYNQEYTFKPKINPVSKRIQQPIDLYQRSMAQRKRQKQKLQKSKEDKTRKQITQCTFKPKIKKYKNLVYTTNLL